MTRAAGLLVFVCAAVMLPWSRAAGQQTTPAMAAQRAESLRLAGRPWHAAETLLAAAAREPRLNATFIVEGAKAELHARRYDRARSLLAGLPAPASRDAGPARAQALLAAGDSAAALEAFAQAGRSLELARLALARGDSSRSRDALYGLMARAPESDDAAAAVGVALAGLWPRTPPERVALARAMRAHGGAADARRSEERRVGKGCRIRGRAWQ